MCWLTGYLLERIHLPCSICTCCMNYLPLISFERIKVNIAACHCSPLKLKWISLAKRAKSKKHFNWDLLRRVLGWLKGFRGAGGETERGADGRGDRRFSVVLHLHYFIETSRPNRSRRTKQNWTEAVPLVKFLDWNLL